MRSYPLLAALLGLSLVGLGCDARPPGKSGPSTASAPPAASPAAPKTSAAPVVDAALAPSVDVASVEDAAVMVADGGAADAEPAADGGPASDAGPAVEYKAYTNDKWGFTVDVPTVFSRELKSGPGSRFLWPAKNGSQAEMYAWGAHYVDTPIKSLYEDWTRRPLTFKELKGNSFVVRGHEGGRLFYSKSTLQDGMLTTVQFEYLPELTPWMEPVIEHVNTSFTFVPLGFRKNRMK